MLLLILELRFLLEAGENVETFTACNMGNSTESYLCPKESLAGWQTWRKLGSYICVHMPEHSGHLSCLSILLVLSLQDSWEDFTLWSQMPPCEPLTCCDQWWMANSVLHFCLFFLSRRWSLCGLKPLEEMAWHRASWLPKVDTTPEWELIIAVSSQWELGISATVVQSGILWPMQETFEANVFQKNDLRS